MIQKHKEFQDKNIQVLVFFAASAEEIKGYAGQQNAPFPIIPDPKEKIYSLYRIETSSTGMLRAMIQPLKMIKLMFSGFFNLNSVFSKPLVPADFLLDENHKIIKVNYGKDYGDHMKITEILD